MSAFNIILFYRRSKDIPKLSSFVSLNWRYDYSDSNCPCLTVRVSVLIDEIFHLTLLCQVDSSTLTLWTGPFPI